MSDETKETTTYADAGVDLDAADRAVEGYADAVASTEIPGVIDEIGGFGGLFDLRASGALEGGDSPVLVAGADGVGTKIKVAFKTGRHDTIGIDCVAMCVNDVLTTGARPLFFLDYLSTGELDPGQAEAVVRGLAAGCRTAGCALLGGETAEMPGFYDAGEYDVAGFCVGLVDRESMLDPQDVEAGDAILGIASNGIHSNGFSLVRKVVDDNGWDYREPLEALDPDRTLGEALLEPTRLYVEPARRLIDDFEARSLAHITGGGLPGNLPRALPDGAAYDVDRDAWDVPSVFDWLREAGNIPLEECYRVFNMGVGMAAMVPDERADEACEALTDAGWKTWRIGRVSS
jgi:phosphoribosylformylglycinamidine cyclo-ligase